MQKMFYPTLSYLDRFYGGSIRLKDIHVGPNRVFLMTERYCNRTGVCRFIGYLIMYMQKKSSNVWNSIMSNRKLITEKIFCLIIVAHICLLCHFCFAGDSAPNILWIITDDQRADSLGCYNKAISGKQESPLGHVESPNIDTLAQEGTLFVNAYCNSPACAPSRASMHTGQYPHHNGVYGFEQTHQKPDFCKLTIPQVMRKNGYNAAHFGKSGVRIFQWGPGLTWNDAGFYNFKIDQKNDLGKHGFTDFFSAQIYKKIDGKSKLIGKEERFYFEDGTMKTATEELDSELDILRAYTREQAEMIIGGQSCQPADKTLDGRILESFQNFLNNRNISYKTLTGKTVSGADSSKPLFIHLGFHFPHSPVLVPKEYRDCFKGKTYTVPEFDKKELRKLPPQLLNIYDKMKIDGLNPQEMQQAIRDYYAFCAYGDSLVGKAINTFKSYSKQSQREYLIILVCGDHGWHLGENGIEAKFAPWEMSNRTAVIVSSSDKSKFKDGKVHKDFIEFVDFAPTIFSAAGIDITHDDYNYLDGFDLEKTSKNKSLTRDYVLGQMNHVCGPRAYIRTKEFAFSMRTRKTNAKPDSKKNLPNENVLWALETDRQNVEMALYDLRVDPKERNNVANDSQYIKLADWFRQKLGNIVLGDGRVECDWSSANLYNISSFAPGADDKKINIPNEIIPKR